VIDLTAQPPSIRLQLLLAKTKLSDAHKQVAQSLMLQIADWDGFLQSATRNFSLPLVRRHLMQLDSSAIPPHVWDAIKSKSNEIALENMKVVKAQRRFSNDCLAPLDVEAIYFKGVTMAAQYYPDVGLRPCRDIDILLPKNTLEKVVNRAVSLGYQLIVGSPEIHVMQTERDIRAALRYGEDVTMFHPDDHIVIDLQERLDKHSGIFDGYDFFGEAQKTNFFGKPIYTMKPEVLFNYACHHHARHTWSNLHWLSDLDALINSKGFDREKALALAEKLGQTGTAEASLELHHLMSNVTTWDQSETMHRGKQFLSLAIRNLAGAVDLEKQIGVNLIGGEFMFAWQARPELIQRARKNWWRAIFKPTAAQYARRPLPEPLHFLYYASRPFELGLNHIKRLLS